MKDMLNLGLRLMVIALIAGLLLGATNLATADRIAQQQERRANQARMAVMPGNESFEPLLQTDPQQMGITGIYSCADGYVYTVRTRGYDSGGIVATVGIRADGKVTGVRFDASGETPGLGAKAAGAAYYEQYVGVDSSTLNTVSAISGATVTSTAAKDAVSQAIAHFEANYR